MTPEEYEQLRELIKNRDKKKPIRVNRHELNMLMDVLEGLVDAENQRKGVSEGVWFTHDQKIWSETWESKRIENFIKAILGDQEAKYVARRYY